MFIVRGVANREFIIIFACYLLVLPNTVLKLCATLVSIALIKLQNQFKKDIEGSKQLVKYFQSLEQESVLYIPPVARKHTFPRKKLASTCRREASIFVKLVVCKRKHNAPFN